MNIRKKYVEETGLPYGMEYSDKIYFDYEYVEWLEKKVEQALSLGGVSVSLLERAASLVGNPATNISGSTDFACEEWQKDYKSWCNEC